MRLLIAAVGQRQPAWADAAYEDFAKRFPPEMRLELKAVKAEPRSGGKTAAQLMAAEAQRLDAACPKGARRVLLDERGTRLTTVFDVQGEGPLKPVVARLFDKRATERTAQFAETLAQRFKKKGSEQFSCNY